MTEEARKARNEYNRQWRAKNKDKIKGYMDKYWAKRAAEDLSEKPRKGKRPKA